MEPQTKGKADPELRGRLEEAASQHAYICMFISHSKGKAEGHGSKRSNEFEDKRLQKVSTEDTLQNKPASPQSKWETLSDINTQTISNRGWDEPWTQEFRPKHTQKRKEYVWSTFPKFTFWPFHTGRKKQE